MKRLIILLSLLAVLLVASALNPTTSVAVPADQVRVYFVRDEKVATAGRTVEGDAKNRAVQALLAGPNDFERNIGMSTDIPAGTTLRGLNVADNTATVDLSNEFQSDGGIMRLRVAEVVFTLTQFADVQRVTITLDGKPLDGAADLARADLEPVTPRILVETPVPGQSVTSPLDVSGIANVFEGTVSYSVGGPDGAVVDSGSTTATAGTGYWGVMKFTSAYTTQQTGLGRLSVWETSMKDGSHLNVYEVPVSMS